MRDFCLRFLQNSLRTWGTCHFIMSHKNNAMQVKSTYFKTQALMCLIVGMYRVLPTVKIHNSCMFQITTIAEKIDFLKSYNMKNFLQNCCKVYIKKKSVKFDSISKS